MSTRWNPSDISGWQPSAVVFSNGDLSLALGSGDTRNPVTIRAINGVASGKVYWENHADNCGSDHDLMLGWSPAQGWTKLGDDVPSIGIRQSHDVVSGTYLGFGDVWGSGDDIDIATDFDASLIWYRVNGGPWNANAAANPATGAGGFSFPAPGVELFPAVYMTRYAPPGDLDAVTARFAAASWVRSAPAGFAEVNAAVVVPTRARCRAFIID